MENKAFDKKKTPENQRLNLVLVIRLGFHRSGLYL